MILKFYVKYQTLYLLSRDPVVADSSGYLQANFQFTEDWDGTNKTAQFKRTESDLITDGNPLFFNEEIDSNGNCIIPWEVLKGEGTFNVNVYGQKTDSDGTTVKTITVDGIDVRVGKSGLTTDELPQDSTASQYDNIYEKILATEKETQTLQTEAAASQAAAKTSETNAASSATSAAASAEAAATSATAAASSATNAATSETNAKTSEANAANSATLASNENDTAKAWATSTESPDGATDTDSSTGKTQSSKTWALYSKDRATASASSASAASTSANNAKASETNAANSKTAAANSASGASTSASAASGSATAAANSAKAAATSEGNAKASETNAASSASAAANSATASANSATVANNQANTAKNWATATTSPDGATDSDSSTGKTQSSKSWATYSKDRATAAASSASSAASSAATASTKATNASTSATAAANSASAASTSATAAQNSQTAAASSASAASSSASTAATHETNAKTALASCQNIQSQVNSGLQALTSAVKYKGSVASYSALPTTGLSTGDMYNVKSAGGTDANGTAIKAGDNLVYNGSGWDDQSGTVDLSGYYTKTEMAGAVMSTTVSNDTITFIHKDATKTTAKVNNVSHATAATNDDKGQAIDVAALKTLITTTVNAGITSALQKVFPVGSIYTSLTDSRNPNAILGFGTWEAMPAGYTLIAQGSGSDSLGSYTYTAGQKYGERKHQLTTDELPQIKGAFGCAVPDSHTAYASGVFSGITVAQQGTIAGNKGNNIIYGYQLNFGKNAAHNNIQPSTAAYCWKRTA